MALGAAVLAADGGGGGGEADGQQVAVALVAEGRRARRIRPKVVRLHERHGVQDTLDGLPVHVLPLRAHAAPFRILLPSVPYCSKPIWFDSVPSQHPFAKIRRSSEHLRYARRQSHLLELIISWVCASPSTLYPQPSAAIAVQSSTVLSK